MSTSDHEDGDDRALARNPLKPTVSAEVESELAFHVEMRTRELVARGMDPREARAQAMQRFGDLRQVHSTLERIGRRRDRRLHLREWLGELRQDLVFALRQLKHHPAFALLTVGTLGIGIGASTSIFSAVYAVVLRPLPYEQPERIVDVYTTSDGNDESASALAYYTLREQTRSFEHLGATAYTNFTLLQGDQLPEQLGGAFVSPQYFRAFGVRAALGRTFRDEEETPGQDQVVILSHRAWVERFAADPGVVGRTVQLNAKPATIIGVMPSSFDLSTNGEEMWAPLALTPTERTDQQKGFLHLVGRLGPGVTYAQAASDARAVFQRMNESTPGGRATRGVRVAPVYESVVGDLRERLLILLGAVLLVLLIACGNVANLLLARGASRSREVAVRAAIGAGRARIVRQLLTESALLGLLGGVAGSVLAVWGIKLILAMSPDGVPRLDQAGIDGPTLLFALTLSLVSAALFGLVPALRLARADLHSSLKEGGRGAGTGMVRDRVRRALVVAEVALSLVLLIGAGLLIRSGIRLLQVDPGFDASQLFTGAMTLPRERYATAEAVARTYRRIEEGVRGVQGVESAALVFTIPLSGMNAQAGVNPEGRALDASGQVSMALHIATPGVFEVLRVPVRAGRDFTDRDEVGMPLTAIINESAAKLAWPNEKAVGKRIALLRDSTGAPIWWEVVGVVADFRESGLAKEPGPQLYLPLAQTPPVILDAIQRTMNIVARVRGEPLGFTKPIRQAVAQVDAGLPVFAVGAMETRVADSLASARFNTVLLSALGVIGLMLATVGIFGVISFFVSQRAQEIGVRMALGATPGRVLVLVVEQGLRPVVLGVILGIAASVALTRLLQSLLYGVSATDPLTLTAVAVVVTAVAFGAALLPARRATRIDPLAALRD